MRCSVQYLWPAIYVKWGLDEALAVLVGGGGGASCYVCVESGVLPLETKHHIMPLLIALLPLLLRGVATR